MGSAPMPMVPGQSSGSSGSTEQSTLCHQAQKASLLSVVDILYGCSMNAPPARPLPGVNTCRA